VRDCFLYAANGHNDLLVQLLGNNPQFYKDILKKIVNLEENRPRYLKIFKEIKESYPRFYKEILKSMIKEEKEEKTNELGRAMPGRSAGSSRLHEGERDRRSERAREPVSRSRGRSRTKKDEREKRVRRDNSESGEEATDEFGRVIPKRSAGRSSHYETEGSRRSVRAREHSPAGRSKERSHRKKDKRKKRSGRDSSEARRKTIDESGRDISGEPTERRRRSGSERERSPDSKKKERLISTQRKWPFKTEKVSRSPSTENERASARRVEAARNSANKEKKLKETTTVIFHAAHSSSTTGKKYEASHEKSESLDLVIDKLHAKNTQQISYKNISTAMENMKDKDTLASVVWEKIKSQKKISEREARNFDDSFQSMLHNKIEQIIDFKNPPPQDHIISTLVEKWDLLIAASIEHVESLRKTSVSKQKTSSSRNATP